MWFLRVFVVTAVLQWSVVTGEGQTDQFTLSLCGVWEKLWKTFCLRFRSGSRDTYYVHSTSEDTSGRCTCTVHGSRDTYYVHSTSEDTFMAPVTRTTYAARLRTRLAAVPGQFWRVHGSRDTYYVHSTSEDTSGRCTCTVLAPSPDVCSDDAKYHYIKDLEAQVANLTTLVHQLANRTSNVLDIQTTMTLIHNLTSQLAVLEADRQLLLTEYFSNIRDEIQALAGLLPQLQADSADALLLQVYHTQLSNLSDVLSDLQEQHGLSVSDLQLQVMQLTEQLNNCNVSKHENPCDKNPCHVNAACLNHDDSFTCVCNAGYTGDGVRCQDEDECAVTHFIRCPGNYECFNTPGSFYCGCLDGFTDTGTGCVEITTVAPTTLPPTVISWMLGESVTKNNVTQPDGTTTTEDSGWKAGSTMVEEISNAVNHTGSQSWYYARGWNAGQPGGGTPFSPALNVKVGRSDGSYTGDVDSFYASFWFKMAKDYGNRWGDGTRIMVAAGDPNGTTASSNHLEINFPKSYRAKLSVRTKESHPSYTQCAQTKDCGDDFGYSYTNIADDLDPTTWHYVQMTLRTRPQDYADQWSYLIDNTHSHTGGAFYKTGQYDEGRYLYVNRLNFASFRTPTDNAIKGIYFDDITYRTFNSSDPDLIHDEYSTSFEPREYM
ncbi:hypothetical protein Bbelb_260420 [Branchiostoma belcheri]|nr:hypothetical protein Bbelb_260420 [Branchiostoma belcheri]